MAVQPKIAFNASQGQVRHAVPAAVDIVVSATAGGSTLELRPLTSAPLQRISPDGVRTTVGSSVC